MAAAKGKGKNEKKGYVGTLAENRKARFDYHLSEKYECGIQLLGTEVRSLREGGGSFADAYVHIHRGEAWLESFHIRHYSHAGPLMNHDPVRSRKLLLKSKQLAKLAAKADQKGFTVVPVRLYTEGRWIKLEIALAKGKRSHDKREDKKEQSAKRDIARAMKGDRY